MADRERLLFEQRINQSLMKSAQVAAKQAGKSGGKKKASVFDSEEVVFSNPLTADPDEPIEPFEDEGGAGGSLDGAGESVDDGDDIDASTHRQSAVSLAWV
jgi:hypothetical protein